MCAIVDAGVAGEVFGSKRTPAGEGFFNWITNGNGKIVIGGKLRKELGRSQAFLEWSLDAAQTGRMISLIDDSVNAKTAQLRKEAKHKSNDPHILALAQVSGARLLYTNDRRLQNDFKNRDIIGHPEGKIFSTGTNKDGTIQYGKFTQSKKRLLERAKCAT